MIKMPSQGEYAQIWNNPDKCKRKRHNSYLQFAIDHFSHFVQYDNVYKQSVFPLFYFILRKGYRFASYITLEN